MTVYFYTGYYLRRVAPHLGADLKATALSSHDAIKQDSVDVPGVLTLGVAVGRRLLRLKEKDRNFYVPAILHVLLLRRRGYLKVVLGRYRRDSLGVRWAFGDRQGGLSVAGSPPPRGTLVQPHWRGECQHPPGSRSHILEGMQVLLGNVDNGSGSGPDSPVAQQKLVFSLQHVESLIVSRLYVGVEADRPGVAP